jgi:hypothetical protein
MYLDAMEFLEEEHEAWQPFEALAGLTDAQLETPVEAAHGWSGRDLMAHMLAWQAVSLEVAKELAVDETSPTIARVDTDWETRGGEVVNAELQAQWAALSIADLRDQFRTQPGELRGYLTVVPEARWIKNPVHMESFDAETIDHYREHLADLAAVLAAAAR